MKTERLIQAAAARLRNCEEEASGQERSVDRHWPLLLPVMAVSAGMALRLGQDISWDVLNYHYYAGYAFLHKPLGYDFAPAQLQSFFNPLFHVLSYLFLAHLPAHTAAALLGAIQGLNFYLVFQISELLFRSWRKPFRHMISAANAAAGFYGTVNLLELGTTFGDNMGSILTLTGLLLVLLRLPPERQRRDVRARQLGFAGLVFGVAFGLKLTVFIYVAAAALWLSVFLLTRPGWMRPLATFYGSLALGFLLTYGVWGVHLYQEYGNPFFPHLNNIFHSPYYDFESAMDARFLPRTLSETLWYPFYFARKNNLVNEITFRDPRLAACYVAVLLLAAVALYRRLRRSSAPSVGPQNGPPPPSLLFLALFFVTSYLLWQHLFSIYRYLIVLELLAPAFVSLILAYFFHRKLLVLALSMGVNLWMATSFLPIDFGRQPFDDRFLHVSIPAFPDLEHSLVLMAGEEASSYIVPQFPARTRFVRISSNFLLPGRNPFLDKKIRAFLARYDADRILVYVSGAAEMDLVRRNLAYFGIRPVESSCREVRGTTGNRGYLCGTGPQPETTPETKPEEAKAAGEELPPAPVREPEPAVVESAPVFVHLDNVKLHVSPTAATAGRDSLEYRVDGIQVRAIDLLYTIDGEPMPPLRNWALDSQQTVRIDVAAATRKGLYHIIGIRDAQAEDRSRWIAVDVQVRIK